MSAYRSWMSIRARLVATARRCWVGSWRVATSRSTGSYWSETTRVGREGASGRRYGGTLAEITASWATISRASRGRVNGTRRMPSRLGAGGSVVAAVTSKNSLKARARAQARIPGPLIRSLSLLGIPTSTLRGVDRLRSNLVIDMSVSSNAVAAGGLSPERALPGSEHSAKPARERDVEQRLEPAPPRVRSDECEPVHVGVASERQRVPHGARDIAVRRHEHDPIADADVAGEVDRGHRQTARQVFVELERAHRLSAEVADVRDQSDIGVTDQAGNLGPRDRGVKVNIGDVPQWGEVVGLDHRADERDRGLVEDLAQVADLLDVDARRKTTNIQQARGRWRREPGGRRWQPLPFGGVDSIWRHRVEPGRFDPLDYLRADRDDPAPFGPQFAVGLQRGREPAVAVLGRARAGELVPTVKGHRPRPAEVSKTREEGVRGGDHRPLEAVPEGCAANASLVSRVNALHILHGHGVLAPQAQRRVLSREVARRKLRLGAAQQGPGKLPRRAAEVVADEDASHPSMRQQVKHKAILWE